MSCLLFLDSLAQGNRVHPYETVRVKKDGTRIDVLLTISPILDGHGRVLGASAIARDITDRKRSEESIRYLATHDPLTGLANYRVLMEVFDTELRRSDRTGRPFAVLLLDVDRLKEVNDQHGHLVGTRALCRLAAILKSTCRSIDTLARYGGDEFAVLLPESDETAALGVARRVTEKLAADTERPSFTSSAGIAVYPRDGSTIESLLGAADRALHKTKLRHRMHISSYTGTNPNHQAIRTTRVTERRRSERLLLDVPLIVHGEYMGGEPFREETFTISVSAHGASVVLAAKVDLGQKIFLTNCKTQDEVEGRIVRFGLPFGGLAQVAIEFPKPAPAFWALDSAPHTWSFHLRHSVQ